MGHYLSEMESDEEYRRRTVYKSMQKALDQYDEEVARGLIHTEDWVLKMVQYRIDLRAAGLED